MELRYRTLIDTSNRNNSHTLMRDFINRQGKPGESILEVGCASGYFGSTLQHDGYNVTGVEPTPEAAAEAAKVINEVHACDLNEFFRKHPKRCFDTIVFGDVLEHLTDPENVLKECLEHLSTDGSIVCSIPNVSHISVRALLLEGRWEYKETGILDSTHLKFFTLESIQELFSDCGYEITALQAVRLTAAEVDQMSNLEINQDYLKLAEQAARQDPNKNCFQYVLTARPNETAKSKNQHLALKKAKNIVVLTDDPNSVICDIRLGGPIQAWCDLWLGNLRKVAYSNFNLMDLSWGDVFIFQRATSDRALLIQNAIKIARKPVIYEMDDWLLGVPSHLLQYTFFQQHAGNIKKLIKQSDRVVVSTQRLARKTKKLNPNVFIVPNVVSTEAAALPIASHNNTSTVTLVLASSDTVEVDFLTEALNFVVSKYSPNVHVLAIGNIAKPLQKAISFDIETAPMMERQQFLQYLTQYPNPIGIIPLGKDDFSVCKSAIKYIDYASVGVVPLCSNAAPYSDEITDSMHGRLVDNTTEDWVKAISELIEDAELRSQMAQVSRNHVFEKYNLGASVAAWKLALNELEANNTFNSLLLEKSLGIVTDIAKWKAQLSEMNRERVRLRRLNRDSNSLSAPIIDKLDNYSKSFGREALSSWNRERKKRRRTRKAIFSQPNSITLSEAKENNHEINIDFDCLSVDIIVCVHNALDDVRNCLDSVTRNTTCSHQLIIVNDGSDKETTEYLNDYSEHHNFIKLIHNTTAKGYTFAANQGLRTSTNSDFTILLNSDTIVGTNWIEGLVECACSSDKIGAVGPLSNCASWQSVPDIFDENNDWKVNDIPFNLSVDEVNEVLHSNPTKVYPLVGFLNGFCMMIKRDCLEEVGIFDEEVFGAGYGEENDFCLRARDKNWHLAIADSVYVYHAQSKSYSTERRAKLADQANKNLIGKHSEHLISYGVQQTNKSLGLNYLRATFDQSISEQVKTTHFGAIENKRIAVLLPITESGGGGNVILSETRALRDMGISVTLVNLESYRESFERHHPKLDIPVVYISDPKELQWILPDCNAVICSLFSTLEWLQPYIDQFPKLRVGYYIQDFEPNFFEKYSPEWYRAWASYSLLPSMIRFTKTKWNQEQVKRNIGLDSSVVGLSYNEQLFYPSRNFQNIESRPIRILAMVRVSTPRRAPERTLQILQKAKQAFGEAVEIHIFGSSEQELDALENSRKWAHLNHGKLTSSSVAKLLRQMDIFIDASDFQAMGLTGLEAMASGVVVLGSNIGGMPEYIVDDYNGYLTDPRNQKAYVDHIERLLKDREKLATMKCNATQARKFSSKSSALKIAELLLSTEATNTKEQYQERASLESVN